MSTRDGTQEGKWFTRGGGVHQHNYLTKLQGLVNSGALTQADAMFIFIEHGDDCSWYTKRGPLCDCDPVIKDTRTGKVLA